MTHSRPRQRGRVNLTRLLTWANATRALGTFGFLYVLTIYHGEDGSALIVLCGSLLLSPHFVGRDDK